MTKHPFTIAFLACTMLLLSGCGSMLAALQVDTIEDPPVERTMARKLEDESVETKAIVNIHAADVAFDDTHINVVSYNGYVLIAGQVSTTELKARATAVVRKIHGVRRIYNELEIAAPSSAITRSSDTWITAKVKSLLLGSSKIEGTRVKVLTENGVVYLMGLVTRDEAERISETTSGVAGVQRVVRLFELVS